MLIKLNHEKRSFLLVLLQLGKEIIEFRIIRNFLLNIWFGKPGHGHACEEEMRGTTITEIRVQSSRTSFKGYSQQKY